MIKSGDAVLMTQRELRFMLASEAKAYQELRDHYGHDHREALRLSVDAVMRAIVPRKTTGQGG